MLFVGVLSGLAHGILNGTGQLIFRDLSDVLIKGQIMWELGLFNYDEFFIGAMKAIYAYIIYGLLIFILAFISVKSQYINSNQNLFEFF